MRLWIASLILCCCAVTGYSQETTETPAEITIADEGDNSEVAIDSKKPDKPNTGGGGCGCGKPK